VETAIRARISSIAPVRARKFRERIFPGMDFKDSPRSENDLVAVLSDPATRNNMAALGLRYVIVLHVKTSNQNERWDMGVAANGFGGGKAWERKTEFEARVVDIYEQRIVGTVDVSNAQADVAGVGFFLFVIPFPIFAITTVESQSCRELGLELADFLNRKNQNSGH
jgi:hypothetical protein